MKLTLADYEFSFWDSFYRAQNALRREKYAVLSLPSPFGKSSRLSDCVAEMKHCLDAVSAMQDEARRLPVGLGLYTATHEAGVRMRYALSAIEEFRDEAEHAQDRYGLLLVFAAIVTVICFVLISLL